MKLIAAADDDFGIGKDGDIPWRVPGDFQFFKGMTYGSTLLVGRKTYENIGGLPGRNFIVLSKNENGEEYVNSFSDAYIQYTLCTEDVWVACGGAIYEHFVGIADSIFLSRIPGTYDCDTFFPEDKLEQYYEPVAKIPAEGFEITRYTKTESKNLPDNGTT